MIPLHAISAPQARLRAVLLAALIPLGAALALCIDAEGAKADIGSDLAAPAIERPDRRG